MTGLRVLITNTMLTDRTGTECYVRDLACGLLRRGHAPVVYSTYLGALADELLAASVPVVDDLRRLGEAPDIIHGQHLPEALTALLQFPGVPAIGVCHDATAWHDAPLDFPRLRRFVAVDEACRDRLISRHGIAAARVDVIGNSVDLRRFPPRGPLPPRPAKALVFSHYAAEANFLGPIREACRQAGLQLDVVGRGAGNVSADPGQILRNYDLVFAKARCALEALAVGTAVILCGMEGCGPLVTPDHFDQLRRWNFGRRALRQPMCADDLLREIARYDATSAAAVSERVRAEAHLDGMLDRWLELYADVLADDRQAAPCKWTLESRCAAAALRWLMPYYREIEGKGRHIAELGQQLADLTHKQREFELQLTAKEQFRSQLECLRRDLAHERRWTTQARALARRAGRLCLHVTMIPRLIQALRRIHAATRTRPTPSTPPA